jgi:patatin-like phospholipase/acyl hydrolase
MFEDKDTIKILSIDGGGIRGIIPALLLSAIEEKKQKPIYELFDLFAGTSTGGILSLLLTKPDPIPANKLIDLYNGDGANRIFKKNFLTGATYLFKKAKYDRRGIEGVLAEKFQEVKLGQALKPVLITSYETEGRNAIFFTNYDDRYSGLNMRDVARATSAAPTYFEPYKINGKGTFVDGGLAANNPAMSAYVEVLKILDQLKAKGMDVSNKKIILVSLGTGTVTLSLKYNEIKDWTPLNWVSGPLISSFFDGNSTTVEYQLKKILNNETYHRFQLILPNEKGADELDNTNQEYLDELQDLTKRYIDLDTINGLPIGWYSKLNNLMQIL